MKEVKFNLRKVRSEKKVTQAELADKLDVSQQHISAYERGERIPGIDAAARIADALGVTLDELVIIQDAKEQIAVKYKNIINRGSRSEKT